jgi:hypothetical protein
VLGGGTGQVFGNNPIWHFDGPGLFDTALTWQQALQGAGSQGISHLAALFATFRWWTFAPDSQGFLIGGAGGSSDLAFAAVSQDRSVAVVYVPTARAIDLNLSHLSGSSIRLSWYDPSAGDFVQQLTTSPVTKYSIDTPGKNASGSEDWVLVARAA